MRGTHWLVAVIAALCGAQAAWAQAPAIYTCIDGKGRRITADRPIVDCIDREQKELNPSGTMRRSVGPSLTAHEQLIEDEKARRVALEQQRVLEEKRRDKALLSRYPNKDAHDRELTLALQRVEDVIVAVGRASADLATQRAELAAEADLYKNDPARRPARLTRLIEDNEQMLQGQKRFIDEQQVEKRRISARFDEERQRLHQLWSRRDAAQAMLAAPAGASKTPAGVPGPVSTAAATPGAAPADLGRAKK